MNQALTETETDWGVTPKSFRASSLPLAMACPASQKKPRVTIDSAGAPAALGSAVHEVLAAALRNDIFNPEELPVSIAALKHQSDRDELLKLTHFGLRMWRDVEHDIPRPLEVEVAHEILFGMHARSSQAFRLTGHLDVLAYDEPARRAIIIDWKSGFKDSDYFWQMAAYAILAMDYVQVGHDVPLDRVTVMVAWLRTLEWETWTFDAEQLMDLAGEIESRLDDLDVYSPGAHCDWCKRRHECEARSAVVRRMVADLADADFGLDLNQLEPAERGKLWQRMTLVEKATKWMREAFREHVKAGGKVPTRPGWEVGEVQKTLTEIKPREAWGILTDACGEELPDAITIGKGKLESIVASKAGRGKGAAAKRALMERLKVAGAIETRQTSSVQEIRTPKKV